MVRGTSPSDRFEEALLYAARLHGHQRRKGTKIPYIAHLLSVAALVLEAGGDEELAIAALLHDAVEDQGGRARLREIEKKFGGRVARIVASCTDAYTRPKPPWRKRKEQYLAHLHHAPADERLVSAADKLHNARAILSDYRKLGDRLWRRFTGGRDGTLWYYRELVQAFRAHDVCLLVEELSRVVGELERLAQASEGVVDPEAV